MSKGHGSKDEKLKWNALVECGDSQGDNANYNEAARCQKAMVAKMRN